MKKIIIHFLLPIIVILAFYSCKKNKDIASTVNSNYDGSAFRKSFFQQNGVSSQIFNINSTIYQTIIGAKGTKIIILPNSFVRQNGASVSGNVQIELKEIYSKKDMILSGVFPTSNGNPLISGGEFYIKASQSGQELKLTNRNTVIVELPIQNTHTTGTMNEFYTRNAVDRTNWGTPGDTIKIKQDSITSFYSFEIDSLNWVNCDQFENASFSTLKVIPQDTSFNVRNTLIFVSYNGKNMATHLYGSLSNFYFETNSNPIGYLVTIYAISQKGNQYYSGILNLTTIANQSQTINLSATTIAQIKTDLSNLP